MLRVASSMIASNSCLFCFMMFLQITSDLFTQPRPCTVKGDGDDHLRRAQNFCDLAVVVTLKITESERCRGAAFKLCYSMTNKLTKLDVCEIILGTGGRQLRDLNGIDDIEGNRIGAGSTPEQVHRGVHRGPVKVALR